MSELKPYQLVLRIIDGKLGIYLEWRTGGYWEPVDPPSGYVLVNREGLAAALLRLGQRNATWTWRETPQDDGSTLAELDTEATARNILSVLQEVEQVAQPAEPDL